MKKSLPRVKIRYPVKSLIKALRILEELAEHGALGVTELGQRLGMGLSTVHRLLGTLRGKGYVLTDPTTSRYMLGGTVARLGDSISRQSPLLKLGTAAVEELSRQCNESVNLAVLDGTDVVYSARHESSYSLRSTSVLGGRWPAHATALGKALLADLTESDVLRLYGRNPRLRKLTPKTISDLKRLLAELTVVRRAGVAEDREENSIGVRCVAVPIRGASGQAVAALSVSGPISRMTSERINALKSDLRRAGAEFSAKLGFREQQVAQR